MSRWLTLFLLLPSTGLQAGIITEPGDRPGTVQEICYLEEPPRFVMFGQVARPGLYFMSYHGSLTISQAIENAGGHTSSEAVPKITIVRKTPQGNKFIRVNTRALLIQKDENYDLFLRKDDVIIVGDCEVLHKRGAKLPSQPQR